MNTQDAAANIRPQGGIDQQPRFHQDDDLDLDVTDVACEAEGLGLAERVFFVTADDDGAADEGPGIDFNVLAESADSVAEVLGEVAAKRQGIRPPTEGVPAQEPFTEEAKAEPEAIAVIKCEPEAAVSAAAVDSASGEYLPATPAAEAVAVTEVAAAQKVAPASPPESPRAQRNRERARRRKERRAAKAAAKANELPEIVLARSEGTDTLLPENGAGLEPVAEIPAAEIPGLDAATLAAALLSPAALEPNALELAPAAFASPALGPVAAPAPAAPAESARPHAPVRSLITPLDIISDSADEIAPSPDKPAEAAAPAGLDGSPDRALLLAAGAAGTDALRLDAYNLLDEADADAENAGATEPAPMRNVILFRPAFLEADDSADGLDAPDTFDAENSTGTFVPPRLRLLPSVEDNVADVADEADEAAASGDGESAAALQPAGAAQGLSPFEKLTLLRAIAGGSDADASVSDFASAEAEAENVILSGPLHSEPIDPEAERERVRAEIAAELSAEITAAITAELTADMESRLQTRADEFALRLLEAQAAAADSEGRVRSAEAALLDKENAAAELAAENEKAAAGHAAEQARLAEELKTQTMRLAELDKEIAARDVRLRRFDGLQDEHEKLYAQFEDLRTAYNEIVTSAMPGLQAERDDFALTVERQVDEMSSLKSSLSGARRRLAVGYSMAAAACIMVVSLPIAGWLNSGADERSVARDRQEVAELRDRADEAERRTLAAGETIIELERKLNLAAVELAKLETRNGDLSRRGRAIAASAAPVALPGGGTPTRASTMALQATPTPGGGLRVNEVRDPAGSIEQVYADNRTRRERAEADGAQMASAGVRPASAPGGRIAVSAVARADSAAKPSAKPSAKSAAKPAMASANSLRPESAGRTAAVRAGEGVAQVVYRVLGTRDPEVINWVIRENGIKSDRRGNPRIYPEQQLRLPGRMEQTASR